MTIQTVFSVTEIDSFQRCRRKWDYSSLHRRSLEAKRPNPALELGSMVHKALELWDKPLNSYKICPSCGGLAYFYPDRKLWECENKDYEEDPPTLEAVFEEVARDTIAKLVTEDTEDDYAAKQQDLLDLGKGMMNMYHQKYGSEISDVFTVVSSEQEVRIPVPGAVYFDPTLSDPFNNEHQLYLEGTIDKLLQHKEWGTLYILDHKTFGRHPNEYELALTQQFPRYVFMARQLGWDVVGIAYDGLWKRQEIPKGKDISDMFVRKLLTYSNDEIEETGRFLADIMIEMADPETSLYHTPRQGCWDCDFRSLCLAQSRGEDVDYILSEYFQPRRSNKDRRLDDI